ncbi:hypothetical protein V1514DRAFT_325392 [Lipomyces japonicus]|uniref:uncharacterized protein n=1 Tax=Lipomyces japonicus TaxID=56871 RepID=UPI0034CE6522
MADNLEKEKEIPQTPTEYFSGARKLIESAKKLFNVSYTDPTAQFAFKPGADSKHSFDDVFIGLEYHVTKLALVSFSDSIAKDAAGRGDNDKAVAQSLFVISTNLFLLCPLFFNAQKRDGNLGYEAITTDRRSKYLALVTSIARFFDEVVQSPELKIGEELKEKFSVNSIGIESTPEHQINEDESSKFKYLMTGSVVAQIRELKIIEEQLAGPRRGDYILIKFRKQANSGKEMIEDACTDLKDFVDNPDDEFDMFGDDSDDEDEDEKDDEDSNEGYKQEDEENAAFKAELLKRSTRWLPKLNFIRLLYVSILKRRLVNEVYNSLIATGQESKFAEMTNRTIDDSLIEHIDLLVAGVLNREDDIEKLDEYYHTVEESAVKVVDAVIAANDDQYSPWFKTWREKFLEK